MYEGCSGKYPDSDFYLYSIPGFTPCNFYDFSKKYTIKYKLDCRDISANGGVVVDGGHKEGTKYSYADVITPVQELSGRQEFQYTSTNPETGLRILKDTPVIVSMDFRDFKYLSNIIKFQQRINDPLILSGQKEGELQIDFSKMTQSDQLVGSKFENAGRMFFETTVVA